MTPERDAVTRAREAMASAVAMLVDGAVNQVPDAEQDRREKEYDKRVRAFRAALLAEVVAVVEGVTLTPSLMNSRKTILTAIRTLTEAR